MSEGVAQIRPIAPWHRSGPVLEVLKRVVQEEKADLLLLGHEKKTFFDKVFFHGSVEDHVEEFKKLTGVNVVVIN